MTDEEREARRERSGKRLDRQFEAMGHAVPPAQRAIRSLRFGRLARLRLPLAIALIIMGLFSFLPLMGIWMVPLGLLLLALDIPALRPGASAVAIRSRRRFRRIKRRIAQRRARLAERLRRR
ncbi:tryptophan synthase subunit beta [Palleronia sediminis]|uniref:Tryptophan synthase subunit beta n=1 Tax=Palleronia sediminis TaxID=2547833 RepID=A0A4R6AJA2_9RHOB|nr:tryptophan synthase subunit beta [Palleronia sediminis]TDL81796.1 tryptophan synthase subunit beta [Palleronia sediminis]